MCPDVSPVSASLFARAARASAPVAGARSFSSTPAPQATLRELEMRIKSVGNIGKITKSMKVSPPARPLRRAKGGKRFAKDLDQEPARVEFVVCGPVFHFSMIRARGRRSTRLPKSVGNQPTKLIIKQQLNR